MKIRNSRLRQPACCQGRGYGGQAKFEIRNLIHRPVLLEEAINLLKPEQGKTFIDATINGGGHSGEILKRLAKDAFLIGIDQDEELLKKLEERFFQEIKNKRLFLINGNFRNMEKFMRHFKNKKADGIIFDLGMSSFQLEMSGRGFSFQKNELLIMTYSADYRGKLTARDIVNGWDEKDIEKILREYGKERWAKRIARGIIEARRIKKIETTEELREIVLKAVPPFAKKYRIHPATRTFQALRIAVNDELNALKEGLEAGFKILRKEGRLVMISFHSLEDRIVKNFFREKKLENKLQILTKKPVRPSVKEIEENPQSRSAKLRAIVKM